MKILCQRCRKEFEISKEQIEQMRKSIIGDITPLDYLDYFHNWSGRCEKGKRHDFVWSLDFCNEVKSLIKKNKDILGRHEALILSEKKVGESIDQLKQKLEELEQKKIDLKKDIDEVNVEHSNLIKEVEKLTGFLDIGFWEKGKLIEENK